MSRGLKHISKQLALIMLSLELERRRNLRPDDLGGGSGVTREEISAPEERIKTTKSASGAEFLESGMVRADYADDIRDTRSEAHDSMGYKSGRNS